MSWSTNVDLILTPGNPYACRTVILFLQSHKFVLPKTFDHVSWSSSVLWSSSGLWWLSAIYIFGLCRRNINYSIRIIRSQNQIYIGSTWWYSTTFLKIFCIDCWLTSSRNLKTEILVQLYVTSERKTLEGSCAMC